jgi:putative ABC transport system permease protein
MKAVLARVGVIRASAHRLRRSLGPSLQALFAHRLRAGLALASVAAGVAAVALTAALGAGAQREVMRRMEAIGTNLLVARPAEVARSPARPELRGMVRSLRLEDCAAISALPEVAAVAPGLEVRALAKAGGAATLVRVLGTGPDFPAVRRFRIAAGRFLDLDDDRERRRVAVLGAVVAATLFPGEDPVGRELRLRGIPFEVVGVLAAKGALAGDDEDAVILVPIRTALRRLANARSLDAVFVSAAEPGGIPAATAAITALLRERHGVGSEGRPDDFALQNPARFLAMQRQAAEMLTRLSLGIGALTLLIGGTGILGLMLLSVRERTGEIGLRMAVGARPRDVLAQFLFEAMLLALGGWLAGIALGGAGAAAVALATDWTLALPVEALLASLALAVGIGLGFGAVPARRASLLPPIEALHTE